MWTGERTSDPYVEISVGGISFTTEVINRDLNPVWKKDNKFVFLVDVRIIVIQFSVWKKGLANLRFWLG